MFNRLFNAYAVLKTMERIDDAKFDSPTDISHLVGL